MSNESFNILEEVKRLQDDNQTYEVLRRSLLVGFTDMGNHVMALQSAMMQIHDKLVEQNNPDFAETIDALRKAAAPLSIFEIGVVPEEEENPNAFRLEVDEGFTNQLIYYPLIYREESPEQKYPPAMWGLDPTPFHHFIKTHLPHVPEGTSVISWRVVLLKDKPPVTDVQPVQEEQPSE